MNVRLFLVSENTKAYFNQVSLHLFSLRKNGGALKDIPVTLVTNKVSLDNSHKAFLSQNFGPIDFKTMPRLSSFCFASKFNALYATDPSEYDVMLFMDCDTIILKPIDGILDYIKEGAGLACRRGSESDRSCFVDWNKILNKYCPGIVPQKGVFEGKEEQLMFSAGVYAATSESVLKTRSEALDISYDLYDSWLSGSREYVTKNWSIEQAALALSCIKTGVNVKYLPYEYNTWGNIENPKILHYFKNVYKINRERMFEDSYSEWIDNYLQSDFVGNRLLANMVQEYKACIS